jgi:hypothetical protein
MLVILYLASRKDEVSAVAAAGNVSIRLTRRDWFDNMPVERRVVFECVRGFVTLAITLRVLATLPIAESLALPAAYGVIVFPALLPGAVNWLMRPMHKRAREEPLHPLVAAGQFGLRGLLHGGAAGPCQSETESE